MKKKVKGLNYDTDTSTALAIHSNGNPYGSMYWFSEVLYISADGEYFLYGNGGAGTCYAKKYKNRCNAPGEAIVPLTPDRTKIWTKQNCSSIVYMEIFGENA